MRAGFQKLVFIALFSLLPAFFFAADLSPNEENALSYIKNLAFEITRYNITGISSLPESAAIARAVKFPMDPMAGRKVLGSIRESIYRCEYYFPEKLGIIEATFSSEDIYVISELDSESDSETHSPAFDWIDLMLKNLNAPDSAPESGESFDINDGTKILEMLEGGDDRGIEASDEKKGEPELPKEYTYTKNDGALRRFSYDGEQFTTWTENEQTVIVNAYGDKVVRKYFDPLFRLAKTEKFKTAATAKKMSLENEIKYEYSGESVSPEKSVEEQFSKKKRLENHYDENGRSVSLLESHYEERELKSKGRKKEDGAEKETVLLDDKKTSRVFDSEGRVIEEEIQNWNYKKLLSGRYSTSVRSTKNVYDYSFVTPENNQMPNLKFYEDGELHLERKYSSADNYSEKLYFDGGFSVEVLYEGGVKKTEIIYLDGVEKRRRDFEY